MKNAILISIVFASCSLVNDAALFGQQNVVVVLDDSGSMDDRMKGTRIRRIDAAKKALTEVLSNLPPETNVGVVALNTQVDGTNWIVPFGPLNPQQWRVNVDQIRADGGTPLGEFLKIGADELLKARSQKIYGSYRLLIVTDGEANDAQLVDAYLPDILSRGLVTDVIGVDMESDHSLATRVHNYRRADDDAALKQAISEVFAETSMDDHDAEADFEMLAALPDGFASQALEALAHAGNEPIVGKDNPTEGVDISFGSSSSSGDAVVSFAFGGLVCCFASFAGLIILVVVIFKSRR